MTVQCRYTAYKTGRYAISVAGSDDGDALPGSPFTIEVAVSQIAVSVGNVPK